MDTLNLIIICVTVLAVMYLEGYPEKEETYETERHC